MLYTHRFDRGMEVIEAAEQLGWSVITLRKVEKGVTTLELLDLMDIAAYTQMTLADLLAENL